MYDQEISLANSTEVNKITSDDFYLYNKILDVDFLDKEVQKGELMEEQEEVQKKLQTDVVQKGMQKGGQDEADKMDEIQVNEECQTQDSEEGEKATATSKHKEEATKSSNKNLEKSLVACVNCQVCPYIKCDFI